MYIQSYKQLIVWQKSIELVREVYTLTGKFPKSEEYNLTSQMRRSSVSIPSNIAEGYKRKGLGEYLRFLNIADASAAELETQSTVSKLIYPELNYEKVDSLINEVQKMMISMIKKLNANR